MLFRSMLSGGQPIINGDGRQTRDYVFVSDVVRMNLSALRYEKSEIFNVGTRIETDVNTIFSTLKEFTASKCNEVHGPAKKGEQQRSVLNSQKADQGLGWKPSISLRDGLQQTVESFRNQKAAV